MHESVQLLKAIRKLVNPYPYHNYARTHKIVFVHIPKTGGTSILNALGARKNDRMHLNWRIYEQANKPRFAKYYKFAVVRNPYERMISVYNYLCAGGSGKSVVVNYFRTVS